MKDKKIILISILIILVGLFIWFYPRKKENVNPNKTTTTSETNKHLYSWKSDRLVITTAEGESREFYLLNFVFEFYEKDMKICYKDYECETHKYSITDNRILNIEGESEISNFYGTYYISNTNNDNKIILEKNQETGESQIFQFIAMGE